MKNTYDFLVQVRNFLLPLSLKDIRQKERDAHSFFDDFSICPPNPCAPRHKATGKNSTQLTFFKIPQILRALPVRGVSHLGYCDISEWHVRSACVREHLR